MKLRGEISEFLSMVIYPADNTHFAHIVPSYQQFLRPESRHRFTGVTYEDFISALKGLEPSPEYNDWIRYLEKRYIVG